MALTRDFTSTIKARADKDPKFRIGLLTEAAECFLNGDVDTGKTLLRDYVNATIGFPELAKQLDKKPESLMRMLSAKGNPRAENLALLLRSLQDHEGIELHVAAGR
jgi:DNA-binding phage protein